MLFIEIILNCLGAAKLTDSFFSSAENFCKSLKRQLSLAAWVMLPDRFYTIFQLDLTAKLLHGKDEAVRHDRVRLLRV